MRANRVLVRSDAAKTHHRAHNGWLRGVPLGVAGGKAAVSYVRWDG